MQNSVNNKVEYFSYRYKYILQKSNEALTIESKGNKFEVYSMYKSVIVDIDNILNFDLSLENMSTNSDILKKIKNLQSLRNNICECINRIEKENQNNEMVVAELLYSIQSECQYVRIDSNGAFDIPSYPGSLEIYKFPSNLECSKGFIIVSDWIGVLISNLTPILITNEGAIMFLDTEKNDSKIAVTLPFNVSQEEFQKCISVLSILSIIVIDHKQITEKSIISTDEQLPKTKGEIISDGLNTVTRNISKGVVIGANKLGELVCRGSEELCHRIKPGEATLNPNIKTGFEYARTGTHAVIEIGGKAVGVLTKATKYVASKAAPHIVSAANNFIPNEWKEKGVNGEISTVDQFALVTGSGLQGLVLLFDSLHDGAVTFGRCAARSSGKIMRHRYGEEVGQTTENALYAAGNLGMAAIVALQFTKKGILKTAAKLTALEVTGKYQEHNNKMEIVNGDEIQKSLSNVKHI